MNGPSDIGGPLSGDFFRGLCDHVFWCNREPRENAAFKQGDIVFCKIDEVWRLFRAVRRTRRRIVLVTGEGDKPIDRLLWRRRPLHIHTWFGTNMTIAGELDARGLPLGLGNDGDPKTATWDQIQAILNLRLPREKMLYANFGIRTNRPVREGLANWLVQPAQSWITRDDYNQGCRTVYLSRLCGHHFVLCPPGNGEDTHRFWEALYCGAVPLIRRSDVMDHFQGLPFVALADLQSVTEDKLRLALDSFSAQGFRWEKCSTDYWRGEFAAEQSRAKAAGRLPITDWLRSWMREIGAMTGVVR